MDYIYVAVLILVLFNATRNAKCDNEDIISMAGCNISFTWILPNTRRELTGLEIKGSNEKQIATVSPGENCQVQDNSTMLCSINSTDDGLIVVLDMFNVTAGQSGNYTLKKKTAPAEQYSNFFKKLVVIGKPKIMDVRKPILGLPFQMKCNIIHQQEQYLYRWRINDIWTTIYNLTSHTISSLRMIDNFSNVTCQVCFNETLSNLSSVTCENDRCSMDSDPYSIHVIYGPDNVSLSREERHFYLKEHDIFVIDCLANCYPNCIFSWKGHVTIESQKLNIIFESRMAGQYACHVTNQHTNITLISDPITLHRAKEDKKPTDDNMKGFLSIGLVGVAVLLVVIGLLLLRQRRKNPSDKIESQVLTELVVNLQTLTNGEISQGNSRIQNRPLPVLNTHELPSTRRYRPHYLNQNRRSRSLHNLMDSTQDSFNPLQDGLSLQGLYSSTHTLDRSLRNGTQANGPIKRRHLSNCDENQLDDMSKLENGNNVEFLYAKVRKDSATIRDKHSDETKSETLCNLQHVTFEEEPQENLYSTID